MRGSSTKSFTSAIGPQLDEWQNLITYSADYMPKWIENAPQMLFVSLLIFTVFVGVKVRQDTVLSGLQGITFDNWNDAIINSVEKLDDETSVQFKQLSEFSNIWAKFVANCYKDAVLGWHGDKTSRQNREGTELPPAVKIFEQECGEMALQLNNLLPLGLVLNEKGLESYEKSWKDGCSSYKLRIKSDEKQGIGRLHYEKFSISWFKTLRVICPGNITATQIGLLTPHLAYQEIARSYTSSSKKPLSVTGYSEAEEKEDGKSGRNIYLYAMSGFSSTL